MDGADLVLLNGGARCELLTLAGQDDGTWEITDVQETQEGEAFAESLEVLCGQAGVTKDAFMSEMAFSEISTLGTLGTYLSEHEEAERIEYMGELLTKEELDAVMDQMIDELLAVVSDEEEMTE